MSLQVWLPLTGHLDNQGLSDITVTNNGATVDNSGKLGKCYIFTGSEYLRIDKKVIDTEQYSISMWFNTTTTSGHQCLFNTRKLSSREVAIYILSGGTLRIDTSSTWSTIPITTNTWYHIVFVQNATTQYLYVNGVQSNTRNATSVIDNISNICTIGCEHLNGASLGTYFRGKINDVRIYDHALSAKEVKELSKGLVAHYKLSELVQPNLFKGTLKSFTPTAYQACQINLSENLTADTTYTVQLWDVNVSHTGKSDANLGVWLYWGGGSVSLLSWAGTSYFTNGHADYLTKTFTITSSQASGSGAGNAWINVYNSVPSATGDKYLTIGKWKLEKGSVATPWTPNSGDIYYSAENVVYDSSGYNYHGTALTSLSISSNTPKYSVSTSFNGTDNAITFPFNTLCPTNIFTMNVWFYKDTVGSKSYETLIGGPAGFEMDTRAAGASTLSLYMASVRGGSLYGPLAFSTWNMITMVRDGTNEFYYVNGELVKTIEAKSMPTGTYYIGAWKAATTQNYYGLMSDIRIYASCLSADDIKELYHTSASIDKDGNFYAYELKEVE